MSNVKNVILKKKIEGVIYDLMVKTNSDLVYTAEGKTITTVLSEILTKVDTKVDQAAIDTAIGNLVDGAPEAYNTLKEIADYISTHGTEYTALQALVGDKVAKSDYNTKMTALDASIAALDTAIKSVDTTAFVKKTDYDTKMNSIDTEIANLKNGTSLSIGAGDITETDAKQFISKTEKEKLASVGRFIVSATQPADLTDQDLWAEEITVTPPDPSGEEVTGPSES